MKVRCPKKCHFDCKEKSFAQDTIACKVLCKRFLTRTSFEMTFFV
jgi:hypothetical protein